MVVAPQDVILAAIVPIIVTSILNIHGPCYALVMAMILSILMSIWVLLTPNILLLAHLHLTPQWGLNLPRDPPSQCFQSMVRQYGLIMRALVMTLTLVVHLHDTNLTTQCILHLWEEMNDNDAPLFLLIVDKSTLNKLISINILFSQIGDKLMFSQTLQDPILLWKLVFYALIWYLVLYVTAYLVKDSAMQSWLLGSTWYFFDKRQYLC